MEHTQTPQMQKGSQRRFKDAAFNLTEVLISFGPDSPEVPTATVPLYSQYGALANSG